MSSALPLVTVITPTYNRADYLPETIESVLSQDYPNLEYIVLDDGSKDDTVAVLEGYTGRLIWESHSNMGETRTVNKGFAMAHGEYVIVVNSDDPILPGLIKTAVDFMEARPEVIVAYPDWVMIDDHSQPITEYKTLDYSYTGMVKWHYCIPGPGAVIRRRAIELEPERDVRFRYRGDYEYWLRVGLHGPFHRIPKILATWRSHPGGATTAHANPIMAREHIDVMQQYFTRPDLPPDIRRIRREALSNACYVAAQLCLPGARSTARLYFLRSIWFYPWPRRHYPVFMRHSWRLMLRVILLTSGIDAGLTRLWRRLRGGVGLAAGDETTSQTRLS